ncbi:MAG: AMP-binding protein [Desulfovibrio sp.]|jgi:acyl-coenzyme A synthetase/AMP-(fatty) acid ligase|nr:AMP-binding protein [Desulfovibrio sp.]
MTQLLQTLLRNSPDPQRPFLIGRSFTLSPADVAAAGKSGLPGVKEGDVVALTGGFDPPTVSAFLHLLDRRAVIVPLTPLTQSGHADFFRTAGVNCVVRDGRTERLPEPADKHPLLEELRARGEGGLILFSSGTTGKAKAVLHSTRHFLARYRTPRKALRSVALLLFDHIGGLNTLLHMLFNHGQVAVPRSPAPEDVIAAVREFRAELLPASPTFLRLLLLHGLLDDPPTDLKIISYGTERMDQPTLDALCRALPDVDFRQTYGMSELGILRVKSRSRDSLWMRVGGEDTETRIADGTLRIRSGNRMLGYLNAPSPFDAGGWYDTGDLAESDGPWLRISGRSDGLINVGGIKVRPDEVEDAALRFPGLLLAHARGAENPLTGMHVELDCRFVREPQNAGERRELLRRLRRHLKGLLPPQAVPGRIRSGAVDISPRNKKTTEQPC